MSQSPVQIREAGGFEYTQFGIIDLGSRAPAPVGDPANGGAAPAAVYRAEEPPAPAPLPTVPRASEQPALPRRAVERTPVPGDGPREVLKAAKARAKTIRAELRHHETLKRELAELERLIAAARQKPESKLRALRAS